MTTSTPIAAHGMAARKNRTVFQPTPQASIVENSLSKGILSESGGGNLRKNNDPLTSKIEPKREGKSKQHKVNSETALWDAFRNGNELAFVNIYRSYVNLLFNYGKKFSSDRELIKDCVQDFFVYLKEHSDGLGPTTSIKFYLLRSFRRRLFIYMEKVKKYACDSFSPSEFELEVEECEVQKFIDNEARVRLIKRLKRCLNSLGAKEKEAVFLYYFEGMSYDELTDVMGYSQVSSARRLIYIALRNLKDLLN